MEISETHSKPNPRKINLPTHTHQDQCQSLPTQTVEPILEFTPTKIREAKGDPELTVEELPQIEPCKEYTKTPIQMLDGIYVNQPKRFLPLAQEAKGIAEALKRKKTQLSGPESHQKNWSRTLL